MRRSLSIAVGVLMLSLPSCSKAGTPESSTMTVFLTADVTADQRGAIGEKLHAIPRLRDIGFRTKEEAYEDFKRQFKDYPDLLATTKPESLPESFKATVDDSTFVEAIETVVAALPGAGEVAVLPAARTSPPITDGQIVQVSKDATGADRAAIEQAIRAIPNAKPAKFESAEAAYHRLKKTCRDEPALVTALSADAAFASYRFAFTLTADAAGNLPSISLSRLAGVETVLTVPVSTL
jgi:cell division protein FtsX